MVTHQGPQCSIGRLEQYPGKGPSTSAKLQRSINYKTESSLSIELMAQNREISLVSLPRTGRCEPHKTRKRENLFRCLSRDCPLFYDPANL
jgi:hypothetical protein